MRRNFRDLLCTGSKFSLKYNVAGALVCLCAFTSGAVGQTADQAGKWTLKQAVPLETAIVTRDIEKMVPFYRDILGLTFISDAKTPPEISTKTGATLHGYRIIRLQTPGGERIKLVQPGKNGGEPDPTRYAMGRSGYEYITFIIKDLKGTIEHLKAAKVPLLSNGEAIETRPGARSIFARDPEGNFVEFVEIDDLSKYRPDIVKPNN